jgi:hypothetical protein
VPVGVGESPSIGYPLCPATGAAPPPSGRAFSQVYASPRVVKRMECGGLWPVRVLALSRDVTATTPSGSGFHAFARIVVADCGWHGSRESSLFPLATCPRCVTCARGSPLADIDAWGVPIDDSSQATNALYLCHAPCSVHSHHHPLSYELGLFPASPMPLPGALSPRWVPRAAGNRLRGTPNGHATGWYPREPRTSVRVP